jgi:SAM-dependent methyltransferase
MTHGERREGMIFEPQDKDYILMGNWMRNYEPKIGEEFARQVNIDFFDHASNLSSIWTWVTKNWSILCERQDQLLEFNDFNIPDEWTEQIHWQFRELQVRISPSNAWKKVFHYLNKIEPETPDDVLTFVNCGPGSAEFEAQYSQHKPAVWFAVDLSKKALDLAKRNLQDRVAIREYETITPEDLRNLKNEVRESGKSVVVLVNNPIQNFLMNMKDIRHVIDCYYTMRARHHLSKETQIEVDKLVQEMARYAIEMDDIRPEKPDARLKGFTVLSNTLFGPLLTNGLLLSLARCRSKKEVKDAADLQDAIPVIKNGMYLLLRGFKKAKQSVRT